MGAQAGIGVGCALVALAAIGGLAYFLVKKQRRSTSADAIEQNVLGASPQEIETKERPVELMTNERQEHSELSA